MDQYWYCGIEVKGINTIYSYISDTGELQVGTYVMVPFGCYNTLRIGVVKSCAVYCAEDVPYPVGRTKHIVREATEEEYQKQPPMQSFYDRDDLAEVDSYIAMEDWEDIIEWADENYDDPDERVGRKVMECYELCLQNGIPEAGLNLGTFYYNGRIVERDYSKAFELYRIAAEAGVRRAMCNCGYCYYYGRHQAVDYAKAYEWFSLGALLYNDANCLYKLGDMYRNGYYVKKRERYAYLLYQRALASCQEEDGDTFCLADAQARVGECWLYGIGVYRDAEKAYDLLSQAITNFYKKRKSDPNASGGIARTKALLAQAEAWLDQDISGLK